MTDITTAQLTEMTEEQLEAGLGRIYDMGHKDGYVEGLTTAVTAIRGVIEVVKDDEGLGKFLETLAVALANSAEHVRTLNKDEEDDNGDSQEAE